MRAVKKTTGFTLIELMITVAVVAILAGVAYPSYQNHLRNTRRADAEGALLGFANAMERYFTENNTYLGTAGTQSDPEDSGSPWIYATQSPIDGSTKYYDLKISSDPAPTATTYTLRAEPISTSPQASDKCGTLTLTNTGVKGITGAAAGVVAGDCW